MLSHCVCLTMFFCHSDERVCLLPHCYAWCYRRIRGSGKTKQKSSQTHSAECWPRAFNQTRPGKKEEDGDGAGALLIRPDRNVKMQFNDCRQIWSIGDPASRSQHCKVEIYQWAFVSKQCWLVEHMQQWLADAGPDKALVSHWYGASTSCQLGHLRMSQSVRWWCWWWWWWWTRSLTVFPNFLH